MRSPVRTKTKRHCIATEKCRTELELKTNANTPLPGATSLFVREGPFSPQLSPGSPRVPRGIGQGSGPGRTQPLATTIPVGGATWTGRGHSWLGRGVSRFATLSRTSMPSFDGFPGQSRRAQDEPVFFFFVGFTRVVCTYAVWPDVGRMSFVVMVVKAVLDGSEGHGQNEKDRRNFEERVDGSGSLVCVAMLWFVLLAGWCLSSAKVIQRRQWRWRGISRSFSSIWASVWVQATCRRRGPMRKDLKGDDSVIAGCGIGR